MDLDQGFCPVLPDLPGNLKPRLQSRPRRTLRLDPPGA